MKDFYMGDKTYEVTAYMTAGKIRQKGSSEGYQTTPQVKRCRECGSAEPTPDHRCEPKCLLCGRDHPTGDRKCKARFKTPYLIKKRQWERKLQENASRERKRTENEKRVDNAAALDDGRERRCRLRSRSRSLTRKQGEGPQPRASSGPRARSRSTSRNGTTPMQRKEGATGSRHHGPLEVSWAGAVYCGRSKVEAAPGNANAETKSSSFIIVPSIRSVLHIIEEKSCTTVGRTKYHFPALSEVLRKRSLAGSPKEIRCLSGGTRQPETEGERPGLEGVSGAATLSLARRGRPPRHLSRKLETHLIYRLVLLLFQPRYSSRVPWPSVAVGCGIDFGARICWRPSRFSKEARSPSSVKR
ncbi:hypothetical protein HPB50_002920 [Hyalomma asiaticum]|uniref:Uncharacterized protein n=1 Tax=Hyalomma asiaticum TaxID=266040 RepID=A0ACB7T5B1_HYAAI|nr:hypothetical protein HPB50_002920 [Hyalomma asiaticum]